MIDNYIELKKWGYFDPKQPTGIIIFGLKNWLENLVLFIKDFDFIYKWIRQKLHTSEGLDPLQIITKKMVYEYFYKLVFYIKY